MAAIGDRGLPLRFVKRLPSRFAPRNDEFDALWACCKMTLLVALRG
jgi:hypothetical protein